MKRHIIAECITFFFILLFLYTGIIKLTEIQTFRQELSSSPLMSSLAGIIAWALPIAEILLAISLFIPKWRLKGLYASLALMSVFTIYVTVILFIDSQISCSCGGIIEDLTPKQHILFNSACVVLAAVAILSLRRQQPTPQFRWLTSSSTIGLFVLVGWLLFSAFTAPVVRKTGMEGRLLPSVNLLLTDSVTWFNTADIPDGKPFIVIGFDPFCSHCQAETADIVEHIKDFKDTRIYYVTPADFKKMRTFYRYFHLKNCPNISMGRDSANTYFTYFNAHFTPFTAIYDARKRLKTVIGGQAVATSLAKMVDD